MDALKQSVRAGLSLMRRVAALWVIGLATAAPALAQPLEASLRGRLVLPDSVTPAASAVIEAVMVGDPAYRSRTLAGANGDFTLRLARGGTWRVSAMRIGYFPTVLGTFTIADREQRRESRPFVISGAAVGMMLARLEVDTAEVCGRGPEDSRLLVATLLAQARAALAATVLSSPDGAATAEWQNFSIFTDRAGTPLTPMRVEPYSAATDRPYRSVSLDSLEREGFYWERDDHSQFNAPDAPVLLSEQFVSSHCYSLRASHRERADWMGVDFAPAERRRGRVGVQGTLWLDRTSTELRRLDFTYVGLPSHLERAGARGMVDFRRLPTDIWVVSGWELRLPRPGVVLSRTGGVSTEPVQQVNAIMISGGELTSVRRRGTELLRNPRGPTARFPEIAARAGEAPVCADAPRPAPSESGIVYGSVLDTLGRPLKATARLTWTNLGRARGTNFSEERNVSASDGLFLFCGITIGRPLTLTAYVGDDRVSEPVRIVLRGGRGWQAIDVVVK